MVRPPLRTRERSTTHLAQAARGVDETTKHIVAVDLTESNVHDGRWLPELLARTAGDIGQVSADKAYDSATCYEAILACGAVPTIPPPARAARDEVLRCI